MGLHVVLHEPLIPTNTGNIARTCLATGAVLHLVHPLGFSIDDKMVRRAGLDYWKHVDVREHNSLEELYTAYPDGCFCYIENFGTRRLTDCDFRDVNRDWLFVFGKETTGIPKALLKGKEKHILRIPISDKVRSLNLANTAAITIYEVLRQQGYPGLA